MSNKASDHLFQLIKSLNKPEKRYFKVYSGRHTSGDSNNYQVLFDAIDKQKEYNETQLLKKFSGEAFTNKFSITKSRLYDTILKSLDAYHATSSIDAQLKRNLHCAEILYKKSLYKQCSKILRSSKKVAQKYEKHSTLLEIFNWERKLLEKDNYTQISENQLQEFLNDDKLTQDKIKNLSEFWNIKSRLFYILNRKGKVRSSEELAKFKSIIDNVLLKSEDSALYYETKYLYHHIYSAYYFGIGDYANSFIHLNKNVEHIENNIDRFFEEPNTYFSVLSNAIYISLQLKNYTYAFSHIEKLRALPETLEIKSNEDLDIKLFSSTYSIELTMYSVTGQFEKGIELIPVIEAGLNLYEGKINNVRMAFIYFNLAVVNLGAEQYSQALHWINKLLNDIDIDKSEDLYCFGQILNLFIHLELGNQRLIPYAMKSTQRYLSTRNRVYKCESTILKFISRVLKVNDDQELTEAYIALGEDLTLLVNDQLESTVFEYFDFISWAKHKVSGQPLKDIIQQRINYPV